MWRLRAAIFLAVVLPSFSCGAPDEQILRECAANKWEAYRPVIGAYVDNKRSGDKELAEALAFFAEIEKVSGITIRWNISGTMDLLLYTSDTIDDIHRIDGWYEQNRLKLRCVNDSSRLVLID